MCKLTKLFNFFNLPVIPNKIRTVKRKLSMDELKRKTTSQFRLAAKNPFVIVLDNVRSQNNIGSIFRTADAFLAEAIYLCNYFCATK